MMNWFSSAIFLNGKVQKPKKTLQFTKSLLKKQRKFSFFDANERKDYEEERDEFKEYGF